MKLKEIKEKIETTDVGDLCLFFITRVLRENVKRNAKLMDKFFFQVYQVDINEEIRQHLYDLSVEQLENVIKKEFEITDYNVLSDDTEHLLTYPMKNKLFSFSDVVYNQLRQMPARIHSIESLVNNGTQLWAYCVGFYDRHEEDYIYTFRKILSGKVAIDEKSGKNPVKIIRTYFNTTNQKLELLKGETVTLDKQVDCIYYGETFYILQKTNFERIVGLEEEYKKEALHVVEELKETGIIEGLEKIEEKIENNPAIHKKLVRISNIGNHRNMHTRTLTKMKNICSKYGIKLNIKNNKLIIEQDKDIDNILKMLADYYKTGEVSGKAYGTFAGKEITRAGK